MDYTSIPSDETIRQVVAALEQNGITAIVAESGAEAKEKALDLIPSGAEVMTMTSVTLDTIGLEQEINESGKYEAVKPKLYSMDRETSGRQMQQMGAAPEYVIGSVHAVTQNGEVVIASNTGSQLPAYAYGSDKVVWVVGAQKIVADLEQAKARIYDHVLPLESERAKKAYGVPGSFVSKLLIVNREITPGRITVILVKEALGF